MTARFQARLSHQPIGVVVGLFMGGFVGIILGPFFGAVLGELLHNRQDAGRALLVGWDRFLVHRRHGHQARGFGGDAGLCVGGHLPRSPRLGNHNFLNHIANEKYLLFAAVIVSVLAASCSKRC